ncbi:hypothetical protein ACO2I3_06830 [Leptospira interrogans]
MSTTPMTNAERQRRWRQKHAEKIKRARKLASSPESDLVRLADALEAFERMWYARENTAIWEVAVRLAQEAQESGKKLSRSVLVQRAMELRHEAWEARQREGRYPEQEWELANEIVRRFLYETHIANPESHTQWRAEWKRAPKDFFPTMIVPG